jgi:hypothetical protein
VRDVQALCIFHAQDRIHHIRFCLPTGSISILAQTLVSILQVANFFNLIFSLTINPKFHISALYVQGARREACGEWYELGWIGCERGYETFPNVAVSKSVNTGFPGLKPVLMSPKSLLERYSVWSSRTFRGEGSSASSFKHRSTLRPNQYLLGVYIF